MKKLNLVRTIILAGSLLLQLTTATFQSLGAAGDVDLSFDPGFFPGPPVGGVNAVAVQPDGKVLIGGGGIARLNADGSKDSSFARPYDPNVPVGYIYALALLADGKVLMGHDYGVSRLNSDGSWDTNFISPSTLDDDVDSAKIYAVAIQSDGKILIAGNFKFVNGNGRNSIARLNANGSLDNTFIPETIYDPFSGAFCMALQSDGKVLLGGKFLTRLNTDGSKDGNFEMLEFSQSVLDAVRRVAVQPDGKVLIGGIFTDFNGAGRAGFARLNADGSLDNGFNPGTGVKGFAAQADGKVLVGGDSLTIGGTNLKGMARLDSNGNLDNTFSLGLSPHPSISTITLQGDGKVLISGPDVTGDVRPDYNLLTRLATDGSRDGTFIAGAKRGGWATWMMAQPGGKLIIGGNFFSFIDGTNHAVVARLNVDGSLDTILSTNAGLDRAVLQPDGKWLVPDASARFNADWSVDNSFATPVVDFQIFSAAAQPDGRVLIGGDFSTVNETNRNGIARLNADGSLDTTFVAEISPFSKSIWSILVQPNGKILIGGEFSSVDQAHRYGLVRLNTDGSLDSGFNHVALTNGYPVEVRNIVLQSDGKVLITGYFIYVHGVRRNYIARLNVNGSLDTTFDAVSVTDVYRGVLAASAIKLSPDGKLLVFGSYHLDNGGYIQDIFRLNTNGSVDASFNPSGGLPFDVSSVEVQPDGNVLISGGFLAVNGVMRPYMARLYGDSFPPSLNVARSNASVIISWPVTGLNFQLQETTDLSLPNSWSPVAQPAVTNAGQISVTVSTVIGSKFFRLKSQ